MKTVVLAMSLMLAACVESQAANAGVDLGADMGTDLGMDAPPVDAGTIDDAMCTGDPPPGLRSCLCAEGAGGAITVACSPTSGACHTYASTCVDPGFVSCHPSNFAAHPGLEAACTAYCETDASGCP